MNAGTRDRWRFGLDDFDTYEQALEGVMRYLENELVNHGLSAVIGPDGREHRLVLTVRLEPEFVADGE